MSVAGVFGAERPRHDSDTKISRGPDQDLRTARATRVPRGT